MLIPYKAVKAELAESKFTFSALFSNSVFFTLIVSLLSTYVLWIFISVISLDAWHIITSVRNPFLMPILTPTNVFHSVIPILPSIPDLRQHNQYLCILQRSRRKLGHTRSRSQEESRLHQNWDRKRRQCRRRNLSSRPRRAIRRRTTEVHYQSS